MTKASKYMNVKICTDCTLTEQCTKAKGIRQVHWKTILEGMKARATGRAADFRCGASIKYMSRLKLWLLPTITRK